MPHSNDILIIGLPRSGTSWVGGVLGSSTSVDYLREPITQSWLEAGNPSPLVDPAGDRSYLDHAARFLVESGRRRLIKEVNPLLIPHVLANHPMQVVLLHRHPCAVALSYFERGWKRLALEDRFGVDSTGDFWRDHGTYQALLLAGPVAAMEGGGTVVAYEDLTHNPQQGFADLASMLDLRWELTNTEYLDSTLSGTDRGDPYALQRDAASTRDRWMSILTEDQREAVLAGYMRHGGDILPLPKRTREAG